MLLKILVNETGQRAKHAAPIFDTREAMALMRYTQIFDRFAEAAQARINHLAFARRDTRVFQTMRDHQWRGDIAYAIDGREPLQLIPHGFGITIFDGAQFLAPRSRCLQQSEKIGDP